MLTLVTAPEAFSGDAEFVSTVLDHLRIYHDDATSPEDLVFVKTLIDVAAASLDGPHGFLGRALLSQEWRLTLDRFRPDVFIPLSPVIEIGEVRYVSISGSWTLVDGGDLRLISKTAWRPELAPAYGKDWPEVREDREAVQIDFTAGYGAISTVPAPILHAIRLLVAHWYVERQPVSFMTPAEIPMSVKSLLSPFRIYR